MEGNDEYSICLSSFHFYNLISSIFLSSSHLFNYLHISSYTFYTELIIHFTFYIKNYTEITMIS